jgi:hypothetical protein
MGFSKKSKTIVRDEVSGLHVHQDVPDGTHGAQDLAARNQSRQDSLNAAIKADWPQDMLHSSHDAAHATYGNALSRMPKPSDYVVGSKSDRFGSSAEADSDPTQGGQPQKPTKQKGIEPARKRG